MQNRIKYLLFSIILISLFYVLISFLIIPDMKSKQSIENEIANTKSKIKDLKIDYKNLQQDLISHPWYRKYLENFDGGFGQKDIRPLLEMFSDDVEIKKIDEKSDKIKEIKYSVRLTIDSPKDFYLFLDYIDHHFIPIKVEFPIIFQKEKALKLNFLMTLYTL